MSVDTLSVQTVQRSEFLARMARPYARANAAERTWLLALGTWHLALGSWFLVGAKRAPT